MTQESDQTSPREYDYWELTYRELALLPDWQGLGREERAARMLERIDEQLKDPNAPPQRKALFACSPEDRIRTVNKLLDYFGDERK